MPPDLSHAENVGDVHAVQTFPRFPYDVASAVVCYKVATTPFGIIITIIIVSRNDPE